MSAEICEVGSEVLWLVSQADSRDESTWLSQMSVGVMSSASVVSDECRVSSEIIMISLESALGQYNGQWSVRQWTVVSEWLSRVHTADDVILTSNSQ